MSVETRKTYTSRDVIFLESEFPFQNMLLSDNVTDCRLFPYIDDTDTPFITESPSHSIIQKSDNQSDTSQNAHSNPSTSLPETSSLPVRPSRPKCLPVKFADYTGVPKVLTDVVSQSVSTVSYPLHHYMSHHVFTPKCQSYMNKIDQIPIPYTFSQAAKHSDWLNAMKEEFHALESTNTWKLVPLPAGKHVVDCKWLFKIKYKPNGDVERHKARLVARGFTQ